MSDDALEQAYEDFRRVYEDYHGPFSKPLGGELLAVLRELEWEGHAGVQGLCPMCEEREITGVHSPDCRLDALLRRYRR